MAADALVSLGVVVSGVIISLTGWYLIDPIIGIVIAVVILVSTMRLLLDSVRLSLDGVPEGVPEPDKVRSEVLDVLRQLEQLEIVEEVEANAAGVICERDLQDPNRLDCRIPSDVVNGLHVFAGVIDLRL